MVSESPWQTSMAMSNTSYYWQGGRKLEIQADPEWMIMESPDVDEAIETLESVNVTPMTMVSMGRGLVKARVRRLDEAMDEVRRTTVTHHVYAHADDPSMRIIPTDTFFLRFKKGVTAEQVSAYLASESLESVDEIDQRTRLVRVTTSTGRNAIKTANRARQSMLVESAEPNLVREITRCAPDSGIGGVSVSLDPIDQWHLDAPKPGPALAIGAGIRAPQAWTKTRGRREIVIAVADDGFDLTHPDLSGPGKIISPLNVQPSGKGIATNGRVMPRAGDYHGTPCAGVAVAELNGQGVAGVAPGCALMPVRFPLSLTDYQILLMFQEISRRADIVSCSWGVGPSDTPMSLVLHDGISRLAHRGGRRGKGLVFCVAAGNHNCPVRDLGNTHPYEYRNQYGRLVPYAGPIDRWIAAHDDVITVSATTSLKRRSAYSSWGRSVDVCAPSDNWDDLDRVQTQGRGITTTDNEGFGPGSDFTPGSRHTNAFGGTSSATPTVAGVAGLVLSANDRLTAMEVRQILWETADKDLSLTSETPINSTGEFDANGFSLWFGHGKVNAEKAVQKALALLTAAPPS